MRLALIPPVCLLHTTQNTNYQLMLPQLVYDTEYAKVYSKLCADRNQFVILDNGAAEGVEVDWGELIDIAYNYDVNEIVIPDVMGDANATVANAKKFYKFFTEEAPEAQYQNISDFKFMFVLQGQSYDEVYATAAWAASQSWISTLGIPRHLPTTIGEGRARTVIANKITAFGSDKDIHFLGANVAWPHEMRTLATPHITNQAYIRGMDTSMPFNYSFRRKITGTGVYLCNDTERDIARPENYFELPADHFDESALAWNLSVMENYRNGQPVTKTYGV